VGFEPAPRGGLRRGAGIGYPVGDGETFSARVIALNGIRNKKEYVFPCYTNIQIS